MRLPTCCGVRGGRFVSTAVVLLVPCLLLLVAPSAAAEEPAPAEPPPLPLHTFAGSGGAFTTLSAYLVNTPPEGEVVGRPALGFIHVHMGQGKHLESFTSTVALWDRVELGYALNSLEMGDLPEDVERTFGDAVRIREHAVTLHHLNARFQAIQEGSFDKAWLPAVTLGLHYKINDTVSDLDKELGGGLKALGIEDDKGLDVTVTATKFIDALPVPMALSLTARSTEAAHAGLFGFTGERKIVLEGNVCVPVAEGILVAAEYRMKPDEYTEVPGLLEGEDDWWTLDACFVVSSHATISVGYAHFGRVLNHKANRAFGIAVKFEF